MIAAILERHGMRTGEYLSPHLVSFTERVARGAADIDGDAFARAARLVREAAARVDATLAGDERVTQFEALTATGYLALRRGRRRAGGRRGRSRRPLRRDERDPVRGPGSHERRPRAHALAGRPIAEIAAEKADVVRPGGTLVVSAGLLPTRSKWPAASAPSAGRGSSWRPRRPRTSRRPRAAPSSARNFALARAAAAALLGDLDEDAVAGAAAQTTRAGTIRDRRRATGDDPRRRPQPRRHRRARRGAARRSSAGAGSSAASRSSTTRTPRRCCASCCRSARASC